MEDKKSLEGIIMAALSTLTPLQLSKLSYHFSSFYHCNRHRIVSLLSSPTLFSLTLHHLNSLSLHRKSLLITRHLLLKLAIVAYLVQKNTMLPPPPSTTSMNLRDVDAVLLLLLLCELRQHDPEALDAPPSRWRDILRDYMANDMLKLSNIESSSSQVMLKFIELVAKCKNFVNAMACDSSDQGRSYRISGSVITNGEQKDGKKLAASVAVVVALPSVEVSGTGSRNDECVICKEDMKLGRDVCKLPCDHLFHWKCILPWLKKTNTCPCCRFQLPSDDVLAEIQRLWEVLAKMSGAT